MSANPKASALIEKSREKLGAGILTDEGCRNLKALLELALEVLNPVTDMDTTLTSRHQHELKGLRTEKRRKIKALLQILAFLILYIIANSTAPTVWTEQGTVDPQLAYSRFN